MKAEKLEFCAMDRNGDLIEAVLYHGYIEGRIVSQKLRHKYRNRKGVSFCTATHKEK